MRRLILPGIVLLILLLVQGAKYGLPYLAPDILPPVGPITMVVVIYESEQDDAMDHYDQTQTMVGKTAQAMRKKGIWRQYDKDLVPERFAELQTVAEENQEGKTWEPWLFLIAEDDVVWNGAMPGSDDGLKIQIEKSGGS